MKVAAVFLLLFATVLCRPAKKWRESSSESSEEVIRRPPARFYRKPAVPFFPRFRVAQIQKVQAAVSPTSEESSDEIQGAAEVPALEFKSLMEDVTPTPDPEPVTEVIDDSDDSDDSDEDDDDSEENDTDEDDSNDTSESGESSTVAPTVVTDGGFLETTADPLEPTIVTDVEAGRGDSLGGFPGDYKSIIYEDHKSYHKVPAGYKSYEYYDTGKKTVAYETSDGNEVEKSMKVYKVQALQVQPDFLEEDTSTPEVESQGLDLSADPAPQDPTLRQVSLPEEAGPSASDGSSSTTEEEEEEEEEESASAESEDSSEEATPTPGAADSQSDESEEDGAGPDATTDTPMVITAK